MQSGLIGTFLAWVLGILVYPGLLFAVAFALIGEWALAVFRPVLTRRIHRFRPRPPHVLQPLYDALKLASTSSTSQAAATSMQHSLLTAGQFVAPVIVLAFLPFPGNPIGPVGQVVDVLALLSV